MLLTPQPAIDDTKAAAATCFPKSRRFISFPFLFRLSQKIVEQFVRAPLPAQMALVVVIQRIFAHCPVPCAEVQAYGGPREHKPVVRLFALSAADFAVIRLFDHRRRLGIHCSLFTVRCPLSSVFTARRSSRCAVSPWRGCKPRALPIKIAARLGRQVDHLAAVPHQPRRFHRAVPRRARTSASATASKLSSCRPFSHLSSSITASTFGWSRHGNSLVCSNSCTTHTSKSRRKTARSASLLSLGWRRINFCRCLLGASLQLAKLPFISSAGASATSKSK